MFILISYDVNTEDKEGRRRLRRIAKLCQNYGQRVQFSVFECLLSKKDFIKLRSEIEKEINPDLDSIRIYFLNQTLKEQILHFGCKKPFNFEEAMIF